ncbi:hypothetical protein ACFQ7N_39665 [Streptomyces niveus]|uniref:hypothetical protein n=1 Tax=Streptomyces niveus TaxID=193462 RepID=UPI0036A6A4C1
MVTLPVSLLAGPAAAHALTASAVDGGGLAPAAPLAEERGRGRVLVAGLSAGCDYLPAVLPLIFRAYDAVQWPLGHAVTPSMRITEGTGGSQC